MITMTILTNCHVWLIFLHFTVTYLVFVYFQPLLLLQLWLFHTTDFCGDVINGVSDSWCSFPKGSGYGTVKTVPLFCGDETVNMYTSRVKTPTYGATCRRFRRRTLNPDPNPNPNPNPNPRTHRNPNPIFSRNRNKVFERKQKRQKRHPNIGQYRVIFPGFFCRAGGGDK